MTEYNISTDAIRAANKTVAERIERECVAAWRAGYDFLYIIQHRGVEYPPKMAFIPSNRKRWPHDSTFRVERYDLRIVTIEEVKVLNRNI